jgi:DNA-binding winged helix-turn-helix (wHTH) protein/tetratricopeptide (TPR) repeat protein
VVPSSFAFYSFGPFRLDTGACRLIRDDTTFDLTDRQLRVLMRLIERPGEVVSKDDLIAAAWGAIAVTDNSVEQVISDLRHVLGDKPKRPAYIQTVARRGYRFREQVTTSRHGSPKADAIESQLAPWRDLLEGRAALETLDRDAVVRASVVFEQAVTDAPEYAPAHLGLANACLMHYESTRSDEIPDTDMLLKAGHHAREACRLDAQSGEAWATLAFALNRSGMGVQAIAAARRAVALEPDNWRHRFRLAYVSWGEERLREAQRTLALLPDFALAHWLAATVHVARHAFDIAERELEAGAAAQDRQGGAEPFRAVGLHWLLGLLRLARGERAAAVEQLERELSFEGGNQLYARECAANTWHALGAVHLREGDLDAATAAFQQAVTRVPGQASSLAGLTATLRAGEQPSRVEDLDDTALRAAERLAARAPVEGAIAAAARSLLAGDRKGAIARLDHALRDAPPGSSGWTIPVEPLLLPLHEEPAFEQILTRLRARAA